MQRDLPLVEAVITDETAGWAQHVAVDVVRSPRRRSLAIHVSPSGQVEVRAPARTDPREIAAFLERHRAWVLRKLADARANPPWVPTWGAGGQWYWRGEAITLAGNGPRGGQLVDGVLRLSVADGHGEDKWRRALFLWHRRAAAELLHERAVALFAEHCGRHRLRTIEFRWMRVTWGTCGGRRAPDGVRDVKLRLNPWLAALPPALCDAILLHELAHVEHMNHGAGFYRRLAALNPDWRAHDDELKHWSRLLLPVAAL